jgi:putative membrane protein insertion efficiency factor
MTDSRPGHDALEVTREAAPGPVRRAIRRFVLLPVVFYRRVLSPMKRTPSCRYLPTCSEYAIEAVKTRGALVGTGLAVWRVLRCNPLFHAGYDPVPRGHRTCSHGSTD